MDDQGGSRGRHAAEPDGPKDAEPTSGSGLGAGSGAHRAARPPGASPSSGTSESRRDSGRDSGRADESGADEADDPTGPTEVVGPDPGAPDDSGASDADPSSTEPPTRGRVRQQDPATTKPLPPSVAEQRARREAQRRERAQAEAAEAAEARKRKTRKRVLIGGGVAVGLVAVVAVIYAASGPDEVEAQCLDQNRRVVDDRECERQPTGGYYNSSGAFVPIFLGGFGNRYQYNYGSRSPIGTIAQGGSTTPPSSGTSVRSGTSGSRIGSTDSGGTVSRGGLGVGGSSSSGSSSGSSGSSSSGS